LNYFNYFTEIEDTFIRRRGKHLLMSPMDWALIESWKEMKVPLHVVLRGIDRAFDSWASKPRKRTVKSLLYCQEEVEAQFAEWLESRVGAETEENGQRESTSEELERPFSRATIVDHLERARAALLHSCDVRRRIAADDLSDALERTADLLADLKEDYASAASPDAQKLEESLTGLERLLNQAMRSVAPAQRLETLNQEVLEQLKPYRSHMDQAVYQQTFENLLLKRLREQLNIPRLSLFYL
jgi:hypothetical protein